MAVGRINFVATTGAAVALTASTAKTVLGVTAASNKSFKLCEFGVSFDATDATKAPVLVELCACTFGANPPGTNSTSVTPVKQSGIGATTTDTTAARTWTAGNEPTTITVLKEYQIDSNKGQLIVPFSLGREPESVVAQGFAIRCTSGSGSTPNVRAYMEWEE